MRLLTVSLCVVIAVGGIQPKPAAAQVEARNAFFVELLGNGLIYSVNYDHRFTERWGGRVGFSLVSGEDFDTGEDVTLVVAPILANALFGEGNHHFEAGVGIAALSASGTEISESGDLEEISDNGVIGTGVLGYRRQPPDGGFVFRVGLTPFFTFDTFVPWFGISFGWSF